MTLGGVARVAMEYRQHLAMLTNISKLSSAMDGGGGGKMMLSNNGANCNGGNGGDTFTCEFFQNLVLSCFFPSQHSTLSSDSTFSIFSVDSCNCSIVVIVVDVQLF